MVSHVSSGCNNHKISNESRKFNPADERVEDQRDGFVILVVKRDDPATVTARYSNIVLPAGAIVETCRDSGVPRHMGDW